MCTQKIRNQWIFLFSILVATGLALGGCQTAVVETSESEAPEAEELAPVAPAPTQAPPPSATSPPPTATAEPSPTPVPPTDTPEPTPTSVVQIMQGELTIYTQEDGLLSNDIFQVFADSSGRIWVVSGGWFKSDISIFDGLSWTSHTDNLPSAGWFRVNEAPDGSIWVALPGSGQKIAHFDEETWSALQMPMIGNFEAIDIAVSEEQTVWVLDADAGKLNCYQDEEWVNYGIGVSASRIGYPFCHSINLAADGSVWVSCGGYLYHFDDLSQSYELMKLEIAGNHISSAFEIDPTGKFWIGTDKGFSTYDGDTWADYSESGGLTGKKVLSIALAENGVAYLGTNADVTVFDGKNWYVIEIPKEYVGTGIDTISAAPDGSLWFGSSRGLFHFIPEG